MELYNEEMLRSKAPAVFGEEPAEFVSDKYSFVPTFKVLGALQEHGFRAVRAQQVTARSEKEELIGKHVVYMRHADHLNALPEDSVPEMLVFNAHNWQTRYKLMMGVYRLICSNGLIVADHDFGRMSRLHKGFDEDEILLASKEFASSVEGVSEKIGSFLGHSMNEEAQRLFAADASKLRWGEQGSTYVSNLLQIRREADSDRNLWVVLNRVQENLIKGGFINPSTGRRVKHLYNIDRVRELNEGVWSLAEERLAA